jgi:hypothetical protein
MTCDRCDGFGQVQMRGWRGLRRCPVCHGSGEVKPTLAHEVRTGEAKRKYVRLRDARGRFIPDPMGNAKAIDALKRFREFLRES